MQKDIPKIYFDRNIGFDIEVANFTQLSAKLRNAKNHDPFAPHRLEFFLILILSQNTYTHFVDFKSYTLKEGSALFIAKNQVHHFTQALEEADGIGIFFSQLVMNKYYLLTKNLKLNRLFNYHIELPVLHQEEMGQDRFFDIAHKLHEEYHYPNPFAKTEMLRTLLHALLLRAERAKETQSISGVKTQWLEIFGQFRNLLEKEYINTRNSRDYASKLFISYKLLNDIVKKLTGKTVKAFIDQFVSMEIKRYLVATPFSINEISYKTGFEEPSNMVKFFKKNTKTTPLKFRQSL